VRPSSGAASIEELYAPGFIASPLLPNIAAPEDGRTPLTSLPPSVTHYNNLHFCIDLSPATCIIWSS